MNRSVIILGDANVDLLIHLPDYHHGSRDLTRSVPQLMGGGTGANTAVALARLGVPVSFVGAVGDDGFGRWIQRDFAAENVNTDGLVVLADAFTPQVIAMVQPDGERHLVIFPNTGGAHTLHAPAHLNREQIGAAAWLHTTGMCLRASPVRETILEGMRIAKAAGVRTSLDLNLRIELWGYDDSVRATVEEAIRLADVVFGSGDEEIIPVGGADTIEAAALRLSTWEGQRTIVARLGERGSLAVAHGLIVRAPAVPVTVVDTIGAGDVFDAGFIAAMLNSASLNDALAEGNLAAAIKIGRSGARSAPTREEFKVWKARLSATSEPEARSSKPKYCEG